MSNMSNMYRHLTILTLLFTLLLAACMPVAPSESVELTVEATAVVEEATPTENAPSVVEATTGCPVPTADTQLISSPAAGYCFLIPAGFERSEFSDVEGFDLGIDGPTTTPGHRERGFVNVTETTTQTLEAGVQAAVDEVLAALPGFTPTQTSLTLGGLPAIQLDNLPGQNINRKVFAAYEGRLYVLTFVPFDADGADGADATAEVEQLYTLMLDSFRFMPATTIASRDSALLSWEGEIDGACYTLTIDADGEAAVGICGDEPSSTASLSENLEWAAVQEHFGNINAETSTGKIVFQGQGSAEGEQWAQALATWASFKAMEINAGRVSASSVTTLAWQLTTTPEHSGLCSQLIVLAYGYAYANQIPCEGSGQSTQVAAGWLSDAELDTFNEWVTNGARIEGEGGYLDAKGSTPVTPEKVTAWANAVYTRMIQ